MFKSISIVVLSLAVVMTQGLVADDRSANPGDDGTNIKVVGKLKTGMVAIGGETTGTVIRCDPPNGLNWQVEFPKDSELKRLAEKLNGRRVTAEGIEVHRIGVEVKDQWIILVTKLQLME